MKILIKLTALAGLALMGMPLMAQENTEALKKAVDSTVTDFNDKARKLQRSYDENIMDRSEYGEKMTDLADELEDKLEGITEDFSRGEIEEEIVDIFKDSSGNKIKFNIRKDKHKGTRSYMLLNFGPTYVSNGFEKPAGIDVEFLPWRSWSGNVGLMFSSRIGSPSSIFHINYGIAYQWSNMEIADDAKLEIVDGNPVYNTLDNVNNSEVTRHAIVVPLQVRIGGDSRKALNVMLGGYAGFRAGSTQKLEYKTALGESADLQLRYNYRMNDFVYGASFAIGTKNIQLYANYDLSKVYKKNPNYELNLLNMGVQFLL